MKYKVTTLAERIKALEYVKWAIENRRQLTNISVYKRTRVANLITKLLDYNYILPDVLAKRYTWDVDPGVNLEDIAGEIWKRQGYEDDGPSASPLFPDELTIKPTSPTTDKLRDALALAKKYGIPENKLADFLTDLIK
jgi:hypothetical protein